MHDSKRRRRMSSRANIYLKIFCFILLNIFSHPGSIVAQTSMFSQPLADGQTLVSRNGTFALGFFSPGNSENRYIGIWFKNIPPQTVVWVANRNMPLNDSSGVLKYDFYGNLVLFNRAKNVVWTSNSSRKAENPIIELLDTGNFVLRDGKDGNSTNYIWQSFDYPSDTLLPDMKLGWNLKSGLNRYLSAWKSFDDPSVGYLTYGIVNTQGFPEAAMRKGETKFYRSGPWNGYRYSGVPDFKTKSLINSQFVNNEEEVYYIYKLQDESVMSFLVLYQTSSSGSSSGSLQRLTKFKLNRSWVVSRSKPRDLCDTYGLCGAYGSCDIDKAPVCRCLKGFKSSSPQNWAATDYSQGCLREKSLNCTKGDTFVEFTKLKLPDTKSTWVNKSMSLEDCRVKCLRDCSCMAYTNYNITGNGYGCVIWLGDLFDIREFRDAGQDLYIRMSSSVIGNSRGRKKVAIIVSTVTVTVGMLLLSLVRYFIWNKRHKSTGLEEKIEERDCMAENQNDELELPLYDLDIITAATNNFSDENKLGEGGFGPVYKGILRDGKEIAVKRLSKKSVQGDTEFKNEVILISKLQHRNLVRLTGGCIQGEEKMLIYEYMPNKSLDFLIFDNTRSKMLDWQMRFKIIMGIARGLLYLHQDSRLRIIHRDLKASNILLDDNMDPKISDFGMARIFGGDQIEGDTARVVGTYGYMSPEYAIHGHFSIKSDVFSFGVVLLEVVSGMKNKGFQDPDHVFNLIGHAWTLWNENEAINLIDGTISGSCNIPEVLRCIHVGLLCVQQRTDDRPVMSSVVLMLSSESVILPDPERPGFYAESCLVHNKLVSSNYLSNNSNDVTVSLLEGR